MKAKVFIGSSSESLPIAYAIQQNIEYDCTPTVWTQGIFQLSSTALDDLLVTLSSSDFGVFVFNPDDLSQIRSNSVLTVRDNVIFELGLFIGKLGKERVFFVVPNETKNLHLPTDLLGVNPGKYDNKREDGNLTAALGSFCNQIRVKLKEFIYQNLNDLQNETLEAKRIATEKPKCWEYLLAAELLEPKFKKIYTSYLELENGLVFQMTKSYTRDEFFKWIEEGMNDLLNLIKLFSAIFLEELDKAFGPPGVAGSVLEIKTATDRLYNVCKELLAWEYRLTAAKFPDGLLELKPLMSGWTKDIFAEISKFPKEIKNWVKDYLEGKEDLKPIKLTISGPQNVDKALKIIQDYSSAIAGVQ